MGSFECEHAEPSLDGPVGHGYEVLDLLVPVHEEFEGRALYASDGHEVLSDLSGGQGDEPGENGSPREVDDLPCLSGVGELLVGFHEVGEGVLDLALGECAELGPLDLAHVDVGGLDGLHTDEFSLAVVVGRDDDLIGLAGELGDLGEDGFDADVLDLGGTDELHGGGGLPVAVFVRIVEFHDVSAETDHVVIIAADVECERGDAACGSGVGLAVGEDGRDPPCGIGLLGDDQDFHCCPSSYIYYINAMGFLGPLAGLILLWFRDLLNAYLINLSKLYLI